MRLSKLGIGGLLMRLSKLGIGGLLSRYSSSANLRLREEDFVLIKLLDVWDEGLYIVGEAIVGATVAKDCIELCLTVGSSFFSMSELVDDGLEAPLNVFCCR